MVSDDSKGFPNIFVEEEDPSPDNKYDKSKFANFNAEVQPLDSSNTSSNQNLDIDIPHSRALEQRSLFD